jgi:hypothetical protein
LGLRAKSKGILGGAQEAVLAGDLLGKGRDEAFAIHGDAKGSVDAVEQGGDVERGASLFKYVIGHVNLRPTCLVEGAGCDWVSLAQAAYSAELSFQGCFKYG